MDLCLQLLHSVHIRPQCGHPASKSSPVFDFMDLKEGGENSEGRVDLYFETMEIPNDSDICERIVVGV